MKKTVTFLVGMTFAVGSIVFSSPRDAEALNIAQTQTQLSVMQQLLVIARDHAEYRDVIIPPVSTILAGLAADTTVTTSASYTTQIRALSSLIAIIKANPGYADTVLPTLTSGLSQASAEFATSATMAGNTQTGGGSTVANATLYVPSTTLASYVPVLFELGLAPSAPQVVSSGPAVSSGAVLKCVINECAQVNQLTRDQAAASGSAYVSALNIPSKSAPVSLQSSTAIPNTTTQSSTLAADIALDVDIYQDLGYTTVSFDSAGEVVTYQIFSTEVAQIINSLTYVQPQYTKLQLLTNIKSIQYATK